MHARPPSYASAGASSGGSSLVGFSLTKETTGLYIMSGLDVRVNHTI